MACTCTVNVFNIKIKTMAASKRLQIVLEALAFTLTSCESHFETCEKYLDVNEAHIYGGLFNGSRVV